ncbi:hypothetical protein J7M00_09885 [bacterium]|nr:hypothetical protein [bacterium]
MKKFFKFTIFITTALPLIGGCAGGNSHKFKPAVSDGTISYGGAMCLRSEKFFFIVRAEDESRIAITDTLELAVPASSELLDYNPAGRRIFFTAGDSVFAYDIESGLFTTLTAGKFSEDVRCGHSCYDGQYFAFASSPWNVGSIKFWRLVVVDAVEGGIIFYCDSLPSENAFQWIKPRRIGYAEYRYVRGELDTTGMFFDIDRNVKLPARDGTIEFLKIPCDKHISPDGNWMLEIIDGKPAIKFLGGNGQRYGAP